MFCGTEVSSRVSSGTLNWGAGCFLRLLYGVSVTAILEAEANKH